MRGATGPSSQRAYAHVLAKEPRLAIAVSRLKPGGEEPVFDSAQLGQGPEQRDSAGHASVHASAGGRSEQGLGRPRASRGRGRPPCGCCGGPLRRRTG